MFDDFQIQAILKEAEKLLRKRPKTEISSEIRRILSVYELLAPHKDTKFARLLSLCQLNATLDIFPLRHVKVRVSPGTLDVMGNEYKFWKSVIPLLRQSESVKLISFMPKGMHDELFALIAKIPSLQKLEFDNWTPRVEELLCKAAIPHLSVNGNSIEFLPKVLKANASIRQVTVRGGNSDEFLPYLMRNTSLEVLFLLISTCSIIRN
jgi:hypothetical protein